MRLCYWGKDGGNESSVWGFWLIEIKSLFSIVLLRFDNGTREVFHNHAFHAISWVVSGWLKEYLTTMLGCIDYHPSLKPIITRRDRMHKVRSVGTTWALSFRGPWKDTWQEQIPDRGTVTLTHGRKEVPDA